MTDVQYASNGETRIAYETFGPSSGEPLLLIMGLDFQMVWWPTGFCDELVQRGYRVARFDNRDTGLTTYAEQPAKRPPYTGYDMVEDGLAVLDAMGWRSAHLVGASLGTSIALATAIVQPHRVRSITGIMGAPFRWRDTIRYVRFGFLPRFGRIRHPATDDGAVETLVDVSRLLASPDEAFDPETTRDTARVSHSRRAQNRDATRHQTAAWRAAHRLSHRLSEIQVPTLFVNGVDDPLVRPSAGVALARQVKGSRAVILPAMGHSMPAAQWPVIADLIADVTGVSAKH